MHAMTYSETDYNAPNISINGKYCFLLLFYCILHIVRKFLLR